MRRCVASSVALVVALGCGSAPPIHHGQGAPTHVVPACVHGTFAEELDRHLPPLSPIRPVAVFDAPKLDASIEPGCVLPFRDKEKPGEDGVLDVGRVVARIGKRKIGTSANHLEPNVVGHGTLKLGRGEMALTIHDDAGDEVLGIDVKGTRVQLRRKKAEPLVLDVDVRAEDELPLPLDALVQALSSCGGDQRIAATEDGDVVEAKRDGAMLWRTRWITPERSTIVDTSVVCDTDDARLAWRTAMGDVVPMIVLASKRSELVLIIERETASWTEDITDPGGAGIR